MKARQYEIWIADLASATAAAPAKIMPVIVVQTDLLNRHHPTTIICPLTTTIQKDSEILRVHLKKGVCELYDECAIMLDQTRTIDNKRLIRKLGIVPKETMELMKENLKIIFDLE